MAPDGGISDLRLISAADQHPPCLVTLAITVEGHREATVQQLDGNRQLVLRPVAGERLVDQLALDPPARQVLSDPLVAPLVQQAPVLGEPLRVARVVDETLFAYGRHDVVDDVGVVSPPLEKGAYLLLRPFPDGDRLQRTLESALSRIAQAAFSSMITPSSSTSTGSGTGTGPPVFGWKPTAS